VKDIIHYVLLEKIGKGVVHSLNVSEIETIVKQLAKAD